MIPYTYYVRKFVYQIKLLIIIKYKMTKKKYELASRFQMMMISSDNKCINPIEIKINQSITKQKNKNE